MNDTDYDSYRMTCSLCGLDFKLKYISRHINTSFTHYRALYKLETIDK